MALRLLPLAQWFELRGGQARGTTPPARFLSARAAPAPEPEPLEATAVGPGAADMGRARGGVSALTQGMRALQAGGGELPGGPQNQDLAGQGALEGGEAGAAPALHLPPAARSSGTPNGSLPSRLSSSSCGGAGFALNETLGSNPSPSMGSSLSGAASAADSVAVRAGSPPPPADHHWGGSPVESPSPNPTNPPTCPAARRSSGGPGAGAGAPGAWLAAKQAAAEAEAPWERARTPAEALSIVAALCAPLESLIITVSAQEWSGGCCVCRPGSGEDARRRRMDWLHVFSVAPGVRSSAGDV